jgi:hypothetical protein
MVYWHPPAMAVVSARDNLIVVMENGNQMKGVFAGAGEYLDLSIQRGRNYTSPMLNDTQPGEGMMPPREEEAPSPRPPRETEYDHLFEIFRDCSTCQHPFSEDHVPVRIHYNRIFGRDCFFDLVEYAKTSGMRTTACPLCSNLIQSEALLRFEGNQGTLHLLQTKSAQIDLLNM